MFLRTGFGLSSCAAGLLVAVAAGSARAELVTIDFDTPPLANGLGVDPGTPFPDLDVYALPAVENLGAAIFHSDPGGPNAATLDQDLLVDSGNILILQNPGFPDQTVTGVFDTPNDTAMGGTLVFEFLPEAGVQPLSIDVIDVDFWETMTLRLTDVSGAQWVLALPPNFTGNGGQRTVMFEGGGDFGMGQVVRLEVETDGSGAVDNLNFRVVDAVECEDDAMCDDGDDCTQDLCENGVCLHTAVPEGAPCNDGDACTGEDVCDGLGTCGGSMIDCNDGNACTEDGCDPATGCVYTAVPDGTPCDDGDPDTIDDACQMGECVGEELPAAFDVGGAIFYDNSSPLAALTSGLGGVPVELCPTDGGDCLMTTTNDGSGGPADVVGIWIIVGVEEGEYEVRPALEAWCFRHLVFLVPAGPVPFTIMVDEANEVDNLNLQIQGLCCPELAECPQDALLCEDEDIPCEGGAATAIKRRKRPHRN